MLESQVQSNACRRVVKNVHSPIIVLLTTNQPLNQELIASGDNLPLQSTPAQSLKGELIDFASEPSKPKV